MSLFHLQKNCMSVISRDGLIHLKGSFKTLCLCFSLSYHNNISQTQWIKQQKFILTQFWLLEAQDRSHCHRQPALAFCSCLSQVSLISSFIASLPFHASLLPCFNSGTEHGPFLGCVHRHHKPLHTIPMCDSRTH